MCGIFGIVGPYDKARARRALATLAHRGPDACGMVEEDGLFLGHRRLSIIDPLPEANQPMTVEGAHILLNGEIYNYRELRNILGGRFTTASDTEVAARAFLRWGEKMPAKVRGMYALAMWRDGALHLFRDPFGKKPLYWTKRGDTFLFASEIKAIESYLGRLPFDRGRLTSYLSYQSFIAPATLYEGIHQLEAGGYLRYEKGDAATATHRFIPRAKKGHTLSLENIEARLRESVGYRLVADAPLGALLSGGIDSSLVAAMAQKERPNPLPTFTVGYDGFDKYDERPEAARVAHHIGSDHHDEAMTRADFFDAAHALVRHLDEPLGDPAAVPLWFLSRRIARKGIKVLLTGDGADELFFGYRPYYEMTDIEKAADLKYRNWLRNYFRAHYSPNREWEWYKRVFEGTTLYRGYAEIFTDLQQNMLLKQNVKDDTSLRWIERHIRRFGDAKGPEWYACIDLEVQLGEVFLKKLDRVTMRHGIEARTPFLDRVFVREILSTDPRWRMGDKPKWLLKDIAAKYLPPQIVERKKKGFSYPFAEWLHEANEGTWLMEANEKLRLFRPDALRFIVESSKKKRFKHHFYALWHLMRFIEHR